MLTIGSGVGGGITLDGKIYNGKGISGSELGYMVIVENEKACTCGRKGCLEAYASAAMLKRETECVSGREIEPEEMLCLNFKNK